MQPPLWWVLQSATLLALVAGTLLAHASSGRIGRHTVYGGFLFVLSLGLWFLTAGLFAYVATVAVDAWNGPPGWGDAFTMAGWALVVAAFFMLLLWFPRGARTDGRPSLPVLVVPLLGGIALGAVAWVRVTGATGVPDPEGAVRVGYLFLDGMLVSVFLVSMGILSRLRRATLGQLFFLLGIATVLKATADVIFLVWPRDPPLGLFATGLYPAAGSVMVIALALHHRAVRPLAERRVLAHPGLVEGQLVLRDAARAMRGLAGELGERLVLRSGQSALQERGVVAVVRDGVVLADAPDAAWDVALSAARTSSRAVLGRAADAAFDAATRAVAEPPVEANA